MYLEEHPMYLEEHPPPTFSCPIRRQVDASRNQPDTDYRRRTGKRRAVSLVLEWAALHQSELLENWERMRRDEEPVK